MILLIYKRLHGLDKMFGLSRQDTFSLTYPKVENISPEKICKPLVNLRQYFSNVVHCQPCLDSDLVFFKSFNQIILTVWEFFGILFYFIFYAIFKTFNKYHNYFSHIEQP